MTPEERQERQELFQELLYQEAREQNQPMTNLGAIETTVRAQV